MGSSEWQQMKKAVKAKNALLVFKDVPVERLSELIDIPEEDVKRYDKWLRQGTLSAESLAEAADEEFQRELIERYNSGSLMSAQQGDNKVRTSEEEINDFLEDVVDSNVLALRDRYGSLSEEHTNKEITANALLIDRDVRSFPYYRIGQLLCFQPPYISTLKSRIQNEESLDEYRNEEVIAIVDEFLDELCGVDSDELADTQLGGIDLPDGVGTRGAILTHLFAGLPEMNAEEGAELLQTTVPYAREIRDSVKSGDHQYEIREHLTQQLTRAFGDDQTADLSTAETSGMGAGHDRVTSKATENPMAPAQMLGETTELDDLPVEFDELEDDLSLSDGSVRTILEKLNHIGNSARIEAELYEGEKEAHARGKEEASKLLSLLIRRELHSP